MASSQEHAKTRSIELELHARRFAREDIRRMIVEWHIHYSQISAAQVKSLYPAPVEGAPALPLMMTKHGPVDAI
jgi:hypothetical protein